MIVSPARPLENNLLAPRQLTSPRLPGNESDFATSFTLGRDYDQDGYKSRYRGPNYCARYFITRAQATLAADSY